MEAALTLQTSAARKARQANDVVALLEAQDPGSHIPPRLSASDEADMAAGRMESLTVALKYLLKVGAKKAIIESDASSSSSVPALVSRVRSR